MGDKVYKRIKLDPDLARRIDEYAIASNQKSTDVIRIACESYLRHETELKSLDSVPLKRLEELIVATQKGFRSNDVLLQMIVDKLDYNTQLYRNPDYLGDE